MTTKTTKKQAESTPAPEPTTPSAPNGVGLPTEKEWTAELAAMEPDVREGFVELVENLEKLDPSGQAMFAGMVDGLHRKQFFDEAEERHQRFEAERQKKLKEAAEIAKAETLDDVERLSLHVIGKLALSGVLTRTQIHEDGGNGLYWLFRDINGAIREALPHIDTGELDCIREAEIEKQHKARAAQVDGDAESDEDANGDD